MKKAFQDMRLNWQFNSYMELVVGCGFTPEFMIRVAVSAAVEFHLQKCGRLPNLQHMQFIWDVKTGKYICTVRPCKG